MIQNLVDTVDSQQEKLEEQVTTQFNLEKAVMEKVKLNYAIHFVSLVRCRSKTEVVRAWLCISIAKAPLDQRDSFLSQRDSALMSNKSLIM